MSQAAKASIPLFVSYAPQDEELLFDLAKRLRPLQKRGMFTIWHRAMMSPGDDLQYDDVSCEQEESPIALS